MELLKDYDCEILYHPRKANIVADVLSRREVGNCSSIIVKSNNFEESEKLGIEFVMKGRDESLLCQIEVKPMLLEQLKVGQTHDERLLNIWNNSKSYLGKRDFNKGNC